MRKLVASELVSVDGVVEARELPYFNVLAAREEET